MLLTLISALGGFLLRLLPEGLAFGRVWIENRHEIAMQRLSMEAMQMQADAAYKRADMKAALTDLASERDYALKAQRNIAKPIKTGNKAVDTINNLIRPALVVTVAGLWLAAKVQTFQMFGGFTMLAAPMYLPIEIAAQLWNESDQAMLSAIIGYNFGVQAVNSYKRNA